MALRLRGLTGSVNFNCFLNDLRSIGMSLACFCMDWILIRN